MSILESEISVDFWRSCRYTVAMSFQRSLSLSLLVGLFAVVPCSATSIFANNAGNTIGSAEDLTGVDPTAIFGSLSGDPNDVAFFEILIREPSLFSAMTFDPGAFGIQDTVLSLFDLSGNGIYLNDDISGANTFSCISTVSGVSNPCPTSGPVIPVGNYYLAISQSANYPVDSSGNEIFNPLLSTDLAAAVSGVGPVAGFDGNSFTSPDTDSVNYDIVITGTTPEPGTWLMSGAGLAILFLSARRRRSASAH